MDFKAEAMRLGDPLMDRPLSVGFGTVYVYKNGELFLSNDAPDSDLTVFDIEKQAKPGEEWRIEFHGPLKEEHFRRVRSYTWEQTFHGDGFA